MKRPRRAGFSLLEVMLATGFLLAGVIVLGKLGAMGRHNATSARDLATAQQICQRLLDRVLIGVLPVEPIEEAQVEDQPGWQYSIEVEQVGQTDLVSVRVTVEQEERDDARWKRPRRFTLTRWVRAKRHSDAPSDSNHPRSVTTTSDNSGGF